MGLLTLLVFGLIGSFIIGLINILTAKGDEKKRKLGITLILIPVVFLLIVGAVCGVILAGN